MKDDDDDAAAAAVDFTVDVLFSEVVLQQVFFSCSLRSFVALIGWCCNEGGRRNKHTQNDGGMRKKGERG